jgi:preprotein translocase subunit SecY
MRLLQSFRDLWKIPEVRSRLLWTFGLLAVFRAGAHIPLPGINPRAIQAFAEAASQSLGGLWTFLDLLSGGAMGKLAVFSLGIAPYITASIIVQVLTKASAALESISREGAAGRRRIQEITRYVTVPICLLQATVAAANLRGARFGVGLPLVAEDGSFGFILLVVGMTGGSLLTLWLGELITERGLGNGQSVLIMAGIVARLPAVAMETLLGGRGGTVRPGMLLLTALFALASIVGTVIVSKAQRRIPLRHPKQVRGRRMVIEGRHYLPINLNSAGVMPIIFASSALLLPQVVSLIPGFHLLRAPFERTGFIFTAFFLTAILFFSYFWTFLFYPPGEIAHQLRESGSFVPGLRPGETTARFLAGILGRLTLVGASFLAAVALLPGFMSQALGRNPFLECFLGGSGFMIVVGVALDLVRKLDSYLQMHRYQGFLGKDRDKS